MSLSYHYSLCWRWSAHVCVTCRPTWSTRSEWSPSAPPSPMPRTCPSGLAVPPQGSSTSTPMSDLCPWSYTYRLVSEKGRERYRKKVHIPYIPTYMKERERERREWESAPEISCKMIGFVSKCRDQKQILNVKKIVSNKPYMPLFRVWTSATICPE